LQHTRIVPGFVPQFYDQRIFFEARYQLIEVGSLFTIILKGPGKLNQHRAELSGFHQRIDTFAIKLFIFACSFAAFVREGAIELGREDKVWIVFNSPQP